MPIKDAYKSCVSICFFCKVNGLYRNTYFYPCDPLLNTAFACGRFVLSRAACPRRTKNENQPGEFLTAIAEQPNEILKCAMYLFLGYLNGAIQFAQSCGGGGKDSSLPWGRKEDEDDRSFAYRCMMQAHRMMKPSQPKRGVSGRR